MNNTADRELERLKARAQEATDRDGKAHAVVNFNRVGRRSLAVREWSDSFEREGAGFVLARFDPPATLAGKVAAQRRVKAIEAQRFADMHDGAQADAYAAESAFWREAAAKAEAGDLTPVQPPRAEV